MTQNVTNNINDALDENRRNGGEKLGEIVISHIS